MWLIDGTNVLGALREDLAAPEPKRALVQRIASFARRRRVRVTCYFDGPELPNFARHLGGATVVFAGKRPADDLIAEQARASRQATVVTNDNGLARRVEGRHVTIVDAMSFARELDTPEEREQAPSGGEWEAWFADPKNRSKF